jgi:hypothetical protein
VGREKFNNRISPTQPTRFRIMLAMRMDRVLLFWMGCIIRSKFYYISWQIFINHSSAERIENSSRLLLCPSCYPCREYSRNPSAPITPKNFSILRYPLWLGHLPQMCYKPFGGAKRRFLW